MKNLLFTLAFSVLTLPAIVSAAPAGQVGASYKNPLSEKTVDGLVTSFLNAMQMTIVSLAIVFIVIGGILYITSAGNESRISTAKGAFAAAVVGLAIAVAAPSFLKEIYTILGGKTTSAAVNNAPTIAQIVTKTLEFLLGVSGTIALIAMVIGGIMYLTAGGDESRVDTGKKVFKSAVVGIIIIMTSLVVVRTVSKFFDGGAAAGGGGGNAVNTGSTMQQAGVVAAAGGGVQQQSNAKTFPIDTSGSLPEDNTQGQQGDVATNVPADTTAMQPKTDLLAGVQTAADLDPLNLKQREAYYQKKCHHFSGDTEAATEWLWNDERRYDTKEPPC